MASTALLLFFLSSLLIMKKSEGRHVLEGIELPLNKTLTYVDNSSSPDAPHHVLLRLNGAGVRSIYMLGWAFKVYVAGFYTSIPLDSAESVFAALDECDTHSNMQLDFIFLRSIDQGRVTDAWKQQLAHSVDYTYPGYEQDRDFFIACFGQIKNGGTETVQLLANGTTVLIDQAVHQGVIDGRDFQKAFLSMWFGAKAVAADLKAGLLGKVAHFHLQPAHNS